MCWGCVCVGGGDVLQWVRVWVCVGGGDVLQWVRVWGDVCCRAIPTYILCMYVCVTFLRLSLSVCVGVCVYVVCVYTYVCTYVPSRTYVRTRIGFYTHVAVCMYVRKS